MDLRPFTKKELCERLGVSVEYIDAMREIYPPNQTEERNKLWVEQVIKPIIQKRMDIFEGEPTMAEVIEPSKGEVLYIGKDPMGFLFGKESTPIILEGWISEDDYKPEPYKDVFISDGQPDTVYVGYWQEELGWFYNDRSHNEEDDPKIHWLPFEIKLL